MNKINLSEYAVFYLLCFTCAGHVRETFQVSSPVYTSNHQLTVLLAFLRIDKSKADSKKEKKQKFSWDGLLSSTNGHIEEIPRSQQLEDLVIREGIPVSIRGKVGPSPNSFRFVIHKTDSFVSSGVANVKYGL